MSANRRIKRILNVALIQMCPTPFLRDDNLALALKLAKDSLKKGANLIVFPELFDSGYCVAPRDKDFAMDFTKPKNHATFKALSAFAKENAVHIVACGIEKSAKKLYDTAYIIAPSGKCVGKHRKIYLWGSEKSRFCKGKKYEVFNLDFGNFSAKVGLQICYEIGFGVGANILALKGAEILIYPSAFGAARAYNWDLLSRTRAVENGCFILACNHSGKENAESSPICHSERSEESKKNPSLRADSQNLRGKPPYDSALFSSGGLPRSHSLARNDEILDSSLRKCSAQNDNVERDSSVAMLPQNDNKIAKSAESSLDSALSKQEANSSIADEFLGLCEASDDDRTNGSSRKRADALPKKSLRDAEFAGDSRIISPKGEIIKCATNLNEAIIAEINLDEIFAQRKAIPYLKDFSTKLTKRSFGEI